MLDKQTFPFVLHDLPYEYSALEPIIGRETMILHHDKHLKKYIDNLNNILKDYQEFHSWTLKKILSNLYTFPDNIINEKTTTNMIQKISAIFAVNPLISKEI